MRSLKNLKITKSIESKRLIYNESILDKIDRYTNYLIFGALIYFSIVGLYKITPSANSDFEYIIYSIVLVFVLYSSYCLFTEKRLKEISFNIHKEEAKRRILEYGKKYHYRISNISNNLIYLNEPINSFSFLDEERTIIIFCKDQSVLYTVIKSGMRINAPVLFSQHIIRKDIRKILHQEKFTLTRKKSYFDRFFNDPS
ncbi:hypothetical protein H9Q08_02275 [Chryseobacterium sp. PS-8]|uniref:YcxB-like protein domain-containing protein n=1 Tax=Chryseobacterium indicum TaxID=2766954 RepID=A0ABS9C1M6_9FLAO|nr:hypothetical protein [Chryseobacterium sp. PS-8]MCF2218123.1 hypothetical protein [Chryseobacterium sp. PS-8]